MGTAPFSRALYHELGQLPVLSRAYSKATVLGTPTEPKPTSPDLLTHSLRDCTHPLRFQGPPQRSHTHLPPGQALHKQLNFPYRQSLRASGQVQPGLGRVSGPLQRSRSGDCATRGTAGGKGSQANGILVAPCQFPPYQPPCKIQKGVSKMPICLGHSCLQFLPGLSLLQEVTLFLSLASLAHIPASSLHTSCPFQAPMLLTSWRPLQHAMFSLTSGLCPC